MDTLARTRITVTNTITITLDNTSGVADKEVFVTLQGGNSLNNTLKDGVSAALNTITNKQFMLTAGSPVSRIYISYGAGLNFNALPQTTGPRYDWVEITYAVPGGDSVCNLTAIDQFGICLSLTAKNGATTLGTLGWSSKGSVIISDMAAAYPGAAVHITNSQGKKEFIRMLGPGKTSPGTYTVPDWDNYLKSLIGQSVTIQGRFFGNPNLNYDYSGTFQSNHTITLTGTIALFPGQNGTVPPALPITILGPKPTAIPPAGIPQWSFAEQIYGAAGPYFLNNDLTTYHTAGENNAYSAIYRDLIVALHLGYVGGKFGNSSANWKGQPGFAKARSTADGFFNHYASDIQKFSNGEIYGFPFTDHASNTQLHFSNATELIIGILPD
ncbi:hypothetical protein POV27_04915 [Aureisphaera galaxeae]|uniref:hypothetical protein n=1 Tax=Aureisphaera galaxeae TaxID=1538023 RepID=UPI0023507AE8|nr:hypothetical protein [Aureisphaera galaxeae]MDC8003379.1 hypothetical protein [Aureisphaera galaxeae]